MLTQVKGFAKDERNPLLIHDMNRCMRACAEVCVVGGGPGGMTAALYLRKQGHEVTIKEAYPKLGGQLQYGIPSYRLPRDVVDKEAAYKTAAGVNVETNCRVEKPLDLLGGGNVAFDCARSAVRLGAEEVHLACLEKREIMTADDEEIEQAMEEGVQVHPG